MGDNNDQNEQDYSLYTEKIIVKASVKYKKLIKAGKIIAAAVIFGIVASAVIAIVLPILNQTFQAILGGNEKLTISKDEYTTQDEQNESEESTDDTSEDQTDTVTTQTAATNEYEAVINTLKDKVEAIQSSIVTVNSQASSEDSFIDDIQSTSETAGIIVGSVNGGYLIVTCYNAIQDTGSIVVKLSDSTEVKAVLLGKDETSNIAVIRIQQSDIPSNERAQLVEAQMDNSYKVKAGDFTIAAGRLRGQVDSIDYAAVTNVSSQSVVDNNYEILDMGLTCQTGDYCFLFNSSGNLIGISQPVTDGTVKAIGISDVKTVIEHLSNQEQLTYAGIKGENITSALSLKYGLPMGIYISEVEMDSPAFIAGLQTGDVITGIDENIILTIQEFNEKLYQCTSGQSVTLNVKRLGKDGYKEITFNVTLSTR